MADRTGEPFSDVDVLRLKRHAILSTSLPFPKLDWNDPEKDAENLKHIRDYSESLANSTLDWYLAHHRWKKRKAQTLHFVIFLFVALAAIPPLLKVGFANGLQGACEYCDWLNNHTGELALVLLGIAGVAKLWDSNAGYTVDWMRFITTAAQISRELSQFQFEWDEIDLTRRAGQPAPASDQSSDVPKSDPAKPAEPVQPKAGPTALQVELARKFCAKIFKLVSDEIEVWAIELKRRYDRAASHPSHPSPEK
jgi:hypothetical protein